MSENRYIHGTGPGEQQRLILLNRLTNRGFIDFLEIQAGEQVLEAGSGLGVLASEVAAYADDVRVVGVEISEEQIAAARPHPNVTYRQGDAHHLQFADCSFDLVYARYVLEHVADPGRVLGEMRRVTRPGGRVAVLENDISLLRFDPPCHTFDSAWAAFMEYQTHLGGDPRVGQRLFRLFRQAGFTEIELSVQPEVHWFGSPGFTHWIENIIGNLRSAKKQLIDSGFFGALTLERAIGELRGLSENPNGSALFTWNRARGIR